ncbi:activating transcription factor 7-interacting protein 1 isoform X2 [Tribolium madens]|uniref:activating transcription factor 7-interacting protein 1 isoform X2 n=1 Tax=Tribolium madens TaxID=41895 RepID=UPI001CF740F9|nr:activating transcription factor 7-interacting protein 1 isoform X2 [Tribolium madens]
MSEHDFSSSQSPETKEIVYEKFEEWCKENAIEEITEDVLLSYFELQCDKNKSTLFAILKHCLSLYKDVDISKYNRLQAAISVDNLKSYATYQKQYKKFKDWCKENESEEISEDVLLSYFELQRNKYKPSTLWSTFSMLRHCLSLYKHVDISKYSRLQALLKCTSEGYSPKKSNTLEEEDIHRFLQEADDRMYLAMKVILIMGYHGACRREELTNMSIDDIEFTPNSIIVSVPQTKTSSIRIFTITDEYCILKIKKYADLRPSIVAHKRFFLTYRNGHCVHSPIGVNTMGKIPKEIAAFLKLPNPELYTGHCFKRTSTTHLANRFGNMLLVKRHDTWKPEIYIKSENDTCHDSNLPGCSGMCTINSYFTVTSDFYNDIIVQEFQEPAKDETEEDILNKFENSATPTDNIDAQLEERLLNDEDEEKKVKKSLENEESQNEEVKSQSEEVIENTPNGIETDSPSESVAEKPTSPSGGEEIEADKLSAQVNGLINSLEEKEEQNNDKTCPPVVEEPKSDNSSSSPKLQNEDSEDLFDISIIRDAAEDNAESAYNEAHPVEENEDSDGKVEDDATNEKAAEEIEVVEEMEIERQELEIEETKLDCESVKETSDGESENKTETTNSEEKICDNVDKSENECRLDEVTGKLMNGEVEEKEEEKDSEADQKRRSLKRVNSEEGEHGIAKKSRTDDEFQEKLPLKTLLSLSEFMKTKKKPTMHDLEEFCVQKICEAIVHKSDLGDVHHQLKVQEQLIETMRKEILQLTKQARDLEIVNKKLMNDLKQHNTTQKPLSPLKITRSVGLQVKFTPVSSFEAKRRATTNPPVPNQKVPVPVPAARSPRSAPTPVQNPPNRQATTPQKPQQQSKPVTPLLSQALRRVNDTPKTPPQVVRGKQGGGSASVIDLTDEDDKNKSPNKMVQKNVAVPLRPTPMRVNAQPTQGIRLATSHGKVTPITSVVTSSAPQVMYVVQSSPQNVLNSTLGQKAVVVNFQSANGVLTSTLNGSAVSVIPKQGNTIQLKPVPATKAIKMPNKHPAPLPVPPLIRIGADKPLKPIPPKPHLTIRKTDTGIILQWKMPYELDMYEVIASYQLYAYQETSASPSTDMWRKVGDVKALALPMACTLTQFADKNKYYFAVRPVDIHKRIGMFSDPEEISL